MTHRPDELLPGLRAALASFEGEGSIDAELALEVLRDLTEKLVAASAHLCKHCDEELDADCDDMEKQLCYSCYRDGCREGF